MSIDDVVDPDDARPAYLLLADVLRRSIAAGRLKPGDQLPSVRQLAEEHNVASMTVQNALRALRDEGLIFAKPGRGNFVRTVRSERTDSGDKLAALSARVGELEARMTVLEHSLRRDRG